MLKKILDCHGKKKFYEIQQSAKGDMYSFDNGYIETLNNYLNGNSQGLSKSDMNNIALFVSFANGEIGEGHKEYKALVEFDSFLAKIGIGE